jgi:hypothetical protein
MQKAFAAAKKGRKIKTKQKTVLLGRFRFEKQVKLST